MVATTMQRDPVFLELNSGQPYLGTEAQIGADYIAQANTIAKGVEGLYGRLVGANTDRNGNPLLVRNYEDLEEVTRAMKEIKKALQELIGDVGTNAMGDLIFTNAVERYVGPLQTLYNEVKNSIKRRMDYQDAIAPYENRMRQKMIEKRGSEQRDLQGLGTDLFNLV